MPKIREISCNDIRLSCKNCPFRFVNCHRLGFKNMIALFDVPTFEESYKKIPEDTPDLIKQYIEQSLDQEAILNACESNRVE